MSCARSALGILFLVLVPGVSAQVDRAEPKEPTAIHLVSDPEGAAVIWKDSLLGQTPIDLPFDRDWGSVRIVHPAPGIWDAVEKTVDLSSGGRIAGIRRVILPKKILLESDPFGAEVLSGDSLIGTTPLRCVLPSESLSVLIRKPKYKSVRLTLLRSGDPAVKISLESLLPEYVENLVSHDNAQFPVPKFRVLAGAVTGLSAGIASVAFKRHADDLYDRYRASGSRELLDQTRRYDLYAGIGYAVLQASLGYLIYLLLLD